MVLSELNYQLVIERVENEVRKRWRAEERVSIQEAELLARAMVETIGIEGKAEDELIESLKPALRQIVSRYS